MVLKYKDKTLGGGSGNSSGGEVYSTEETMIGTWMGDDLYRKMYTISNVTLIKDEWVVVLDTEMNIGIKKIYFSVVRSDGMEEVFPNRQTQVAVENGNKIEATLSNVFSTSITYSSSNIIIEYTKTTDQATIIPTQTEQTQKIDAFEMIRLPVTASGGTEMI